MGSKVLTMKSKNEKHRFLFIFHVVGVTKVLVSCSENLFLLLKLLVPEMFCEPLIQFYSNV
jgi:hypothetical protein